MKRLLFLSLLLGILSYQPLSAFDLKPALPKKPRFSKSLAPKKFEVDRLVYGGTFGATFGTTTYVDVSPLIGYRITDDLVAGIGVTYMYFRQRYNTQVYQTSLYGGRVFANYAILENVFLHGEYEVLNYDYYDFLSQENSRAWFGTPLLGGGYRQPISDRAAFMIFALYALNSDNPRSPYYQNPLVIRVGLFL